jgi:hypothetical protein
LGATRPSAQPIERTGIPQGGTTPDRRREHEAAPRRSARSLLRLGILEVVQVERLFADPLAPDTLNRLLPPTAVSTIGGFLACGRCCRRPIQT